MGSSGQQTLRMGFTVSPLKRLEKASDHELAVGVGCRLSPCLVHATQIELVLISLFLFFF